VAAMLAGVVAGQVMAPGAPVRAAVLAAAGVLTGLAMLLAGYVAAGNGGAAAIKPSSAIAGQP